MPNNVNLSSTARIIKMALMMAVNSGIRPRRSGAIQALLSPSLAEVRSKFSPYSTERSDVAVNWTIPGGRTIPCPTVVHNYRPAYALTADSERIRAADEADLTTGVSETVVYNYFKQKAYSTTPAKVLYEDKTVNYLEQLQAGKIALPSLPGAIGKALSLIGAEFISSFDATFMVPTEAWALTFLMSKVGTNAAYPDAVSPSAAAPVIEIDAFDAVGAPKPEVMDFFKETKVANKFQGRPIVVGGMTMLRYLDRKEIMAVNDGGFDFAKVFNQVDVEFYYSETIETVGGAGYFLCFDTAAAMAETFCYHDFEQFRDPLNTGDTIDEKIGVSLVRFPDDNGALANGAASFIRKMDVRIKTARDTTDFSKVSFTPSLAGGLWGRPAGYFTNEDDNPLKTMTGVFAGKLI